VNGVRVLLLVTEKLPVPPVRGGAIQTYIDAVAPLLTGPHSLTILGVTDPLLPDHEVVGGIEYVRVPGGSTLEFYLPGVISYLQGRQFDLIHIFNRPRLVLPVRQAVPGARIVLSMHNDMFLPNKINPDEGAQAIAQVERIVTVSDYVGRSIVRDFPQAAPKLRTIYSGVDLERFTPHWSGEAANVRDAIRREYGLAGKQVMLFVGRLSAKKGAHVLIQAMPALAQRHPDAAMVLVGSKWYGEDKVSDYVGYVRALAARAPIPVVTTGFVLPDQIHRWFWAGDIFVCASQWEEPLARVHYEAMAAGLPIVTTNRGGNPEVVAGAGNGLVIDQPEAPEAFAQAFSTLLRDPARSRAMGAQGRKLAEERYSWNRVAKEIRAVWAEA
jgi:spore coat protein SA